MSQKPQEILNQYAKKLGVPPLPYIPNPLLTEGANVFLYVVGITANHFGLFSGKSFDYEELVRIGRQSYELISNEFQGDTSSFVFENRAVSSPEGHSIPVRIYNQLDAAKPVILYVHGGGWRQGSLETHHALCGHLSDKTGYPVVAVDYRLAPENPYPAGLNDVRCVYQWLLEQGYDASKIILSGDSAGGNIVSCLALQIREKKEPLPAALAIFYPSVDLRIQEDFSKNPYAEGYFLTQERVNALIKDYLQDHLADGKISPFVSPLMADDFENFPPVIMISAECDPLTLEGKLLAEKIRNQKGKIHHWVVPKVLHGFAQFFDLYPEAHESLEFFAEKLQEIMKEN
jgi:acetyl esterase